MDNLYTRLRDEMDPHMGQRHLDFGCGTGMFTFGIAAVNPQTTVIGCDKVPEKIVYAKKRYQAGNLQYTLLPPGLGKFESVSLTFVMHETGPSILHEIKHRLHPSGILAITDYNLKGITLNEFLEVFRSKAELREIEQKGKEQAWQEHTRYGLEDCKREGEKIGLQTIVEKKILGKYYIWIAKNVPAETFKS